MTLPSFLSLPEVKPHLEYTDGVVTQKAAANPTHGSIQTLLASLFNQVAGPQRLGLAYSETRFVTANWAPVPDVVYYRRDRIRRRGKRPPADFTEAPDLAVEIASPEQSITELIRKCMRYTALGTTDAILVDPDQETVLEFRSEQPLRVLQGDDRIGVDDVLPGFALTVREMFDALAPDWLDDDEPDGADRI